MELQKPGCDVSSEVERLDALLQNDPNLPSISYQAYENVPIYMSWDRKEIALGAGFDTKLAAAGVAEPFRPSAFSPAALQGAALEVNVNVGKGSYRLASSSQSATAYEHMNFSFVVSAGGDVLGATGSGAYARDVYCNRDSNKISTSSNVRTGVIGFTEIPPLSVMAREKIRDRSANANDAFRESFGDYFVAGLCLGADNATFMSSAAGVDLAAEMQRVQVEGTVLGITETLWSEDVEERYAASAFSLTFNGLDTLSGFQLTSTAADAAEYQRVSALAAQNVANGKTLDKRVQTCADGLDLQAGRPLTAERCRAVCESGLVVELLLMPYAGLKEYVTTVSSHL